VDTISRYAADGSELDDMAILCRTNAMSGAFEAACIQAAVPCVVVGGKPFFQRYEVMNALAYVKLSYTDDLEAFARIVNKPRRYLGARFVAQVKAALHEAGGLVKAVELSARRVYKKQQDAAIELYAWLLELRAKAWPESLDMIVRLLTPAQDSDAGEADSDRSGLIAAVASLGRGFTSPESFVAFAERCAGEVVEARAEDGGFVLPAGRVTISTIHKAKGLEWAHVFVSASKGTFPRARSASGARRDEELRLWYVAVSRAKDTLHASWSEVDLYGRPAGPSPFLDTLSEQQPDPDDDPDGGLDPDPLPIEVESGNGPSNPSLPEPEAFAATLEEIRAVARDFPSTWCSAAPAVEPEKVFSLPEGQSPVPLDRSGVEVTPVPSTTELASIMMAATCKDDGLASERVVMARNPSTAPDEVLARLKLQPKAAVVRGQLVQRPFAGLAGRFDCSEPSAQNIPKAKPPRIRRKDKK
jgi:hypothetical protein